MEVGSYPSTQQFFKNFSGLLNLFIDVCTDVNVDCNRCGYVDDDSRKDWVTVLCPKGGLIGKHLVLGFTGSATLCEIEIYGTI